MLPGHTPKVSPLQEPLVPATRTSGTREDQRWGAASAVRARGLRRPGAQELVAAAALLPAGREWGLVSGNWPLTRLPSVARVCVSTFFGEGFPLKFSAPFFPHGCWASELKGPLQGEK